MNKCFYAGVGRSNITPTGGVDLVGTSRRSQPSVGIHQELLATCLVLAADETRVALVDCDLLAIPDPTAREWRERIGRVIGAPAEHVLLGCTHTHHAPPTSPHMPKIGGDQTRLSDLEQAYFVNLGYQLENAARLAVERLVPARFAAGRGQIALNVNRREQLDDGQVVLGRNFDAPCDHEVAVLRVDTLDGTPLAAVVTYATHPLLHPMIRLISPDLAGSARKVLEKVTGATALYFTGAAGNVFGLKALTTDLRVAESVGGQLGAEAARVFLALETQPSEPRVTFLQSVSTLKVYESVPVERDAITHFGAATRRLRLALQPLPSLAEAEEVLRERSERIEALRATGASPDDINPAIYQELWARKLVESIRTGTAPTSVEAEIQAIRLDDVAFVAVPGEAFVEMGLAVKAGSPLRHTFFVAYANGALGYIPTRDAYPLGGYEVVDAYKGYGFPAALAPGAAETIVETCLELLGELVREGA
ncbi:MAG: neutral/alkaline non-lysosomal ceramidase N-terminal domain-containing protein [Ardenticatenaceae bacterium]|nr:neutral/alkaline non-lysosomal ceramidase N-terminal domain-containing protein [Ardenticatenaceae bacterium]